MTDDGEARNRRLYGRRVGKPLSPLRASLFEENYPRLAIDLSAPRIADLATLFPHAPRRIKLEIGFGGGEHLVAEAVAHPKTGFIGVEPFVNGMAKAVATVAERRIGNVRFYEGDGADLLDWLPDASVDEADLLYPDPWPKKRHWKRRFVGPDNLVRLARVLKPGSLFHVASDVPDYVAWSLRQIAASPDFVWTAERSSDWTEPYPGWPGTRYEAKAIAAGRVPTYLTFRRA